MRSGGIAAKNVVNTFLARYRRVRRFASQSKGFETF